MNLYTRFMDFLFKKSETEKTNIKDKIVTYSPSTDNEQLKTISADTILPTGNNTRGQFYALSEETACKSACTVYNDLSRYDVSTSNNKEYYTNVLSNELVSEDADTGYNNISSTSDNEEVNINALSEETEPKKLTTERYSCDCPEVNDAFGNKFNNEAVRRLEPKFVELCYGTDGLEDKYNKTLPFIRLPLKETNSNALQSANKSIFENSGNKFNTIRVQLDHDNFKHTSNQTCSAETHNSVNADFHQVFDERNNMNFNLTDGSKCYHVGKLETRLSFKRQAFSSDDSCTKEKNPALTNHPRIDDESEIHHGEEILINDICRNRWQLQDVITDRGGCFQTKHSDVRLTIQPKSVHINTTISGSILLDIPVLRSKFKLPKTQIIVAPTVEYHLQGVSHLKLHACLELPHCMGSGIVHKMQVWWCEDVRGNVTKNSIPFIAKSAKEIDQNMDIFWMKGTRRDTINIFAKHFCVILCTACEEDVEFDIRALLFHKFGDIDPLTLTLQLHLGGPLSKIKDFEQATMEKMKRKNLIFIEETELNLLPRLQGTLRFHLDLLEIANGKWEHMTKENRNPVYASKQNIDVRRIARCGNEHVINDGVKWWLKCVTVSTNTCCFCTDVIHDAHASNAESEATAKTTMHAELQVPEERQRVRVSQVQHNQNCPERRIIERLMVGFNGQDISRSRELFGTFGIPFEVERATQEDYWQRKLGELLRNRGLDYFISELGRFLLNRGETVLLREINTYLPHHRNHTTSGLRNDSNLPYLQPPNDTSIMRY